jgi:Ca-activated chloride channel family protein
MKTLWSVRRLIICLLVAVLLGLPILAFAQEQGEQPSGSGPKPAVGETVLVPKKTAPAAAPKPEEKKLERINPNEVFTLSTTTNLVNVDVMVLDPSGNPIPHLGKVNFKLYDDGVPQAVSNFAPSEAPMTVCMLVEFSNKWWGFLYLALQDAYEFVRVVEPRDWVAVVSFDMRAQILQDFTQNRQEVKEALDSLRMPGLSEINLWDALAFTIDRMKDIQGRKAILLVATGCDTFSKLTYDQILKIVRNSDTAVYPVSILEFIAVRYGDNIPCGPGTGGFGMSTNVPVARNALSTIAKYSGGTAYFPRFETELPSIYEQIAGQLRLQYSLGFVPTNPAKDGKFHKLKVELVDPVGNPLKIVDQKGKNVKYRVVARDGYYAPKS